MTLLSANRTADHDIMALPGQGFKMYVGFGNEIKIAVDGNMHSPPPTIYPEHLDMVPFRPTAVLGPHRIGFVGEGVPFYGGFSYSRWRRVAVNHSWSATGSPDIAVTLDEGRTYPGGPQYANALITWDTPGIYVVSLTVTDDEKDTTHTGTRQVIIYPSREEAYDGIVEVSGLSGSIEGGGWNVDLKAKGDLSFLLSARELAGYIPVVIYVDMYFETSYGVWERKEFGPNWHSPALRTDPRIIFSGYLDHASIEIDAMTSTATFSARTADLMLEQMQTGAVGFFESAYDGAGITFNDLMTHDVIRHMVQEHSNWADWNDIRLFYTIYDKADNTGVAGTGMEYKDWTFNQGMYLSNIKDTADNQFERVWCDRTGCMHIYPDRNMWSAEVYHRSPTSLLARIESEDAPISIIAMHPGANICIPMEPLRITERLSQSVSYYKIIASLSFYNEEWGADYPQGSPAPASGKWVLIQGKYYSDQNRDDAWTNLWHFAHRGYAAVNARYTFAVSFGLHTYWRLGDIIEVRYADPQGRVSWDISDPPTNYFEVESVNYDPNLESMQWRTSYTLRELTTYTAPTGSIPSTPTMGQGSS